MIGATLSLGVASASFDAIQYCSEQGEAFALIHQSTTPHAIFASRTNNFEADMVASARFLFFIGIAAPQSPVGFGVNRAWNMETLVYVRDDFEVFMLMYFYNVGVACIFEFPW